MKSLNKEDKEFIAIVAGICFIIIGFSVAIFTTIRPRTTTPKKYVEECKTNYVKLPRQECWYKEVK